MVDYQYINVFAKSILLNTFSCCVFAWQAGEI